ncbi:MAG TPA: hypothetical protein VFE32_22020 [Puia sp.]|nr:hypothetical protein [Puia sp.]
MRRPTIRKAVSAPSGPIPRVARSLLTSCSISASGSARSSTHSAGMVSLSAS